MIKSIVMKQNMGTIDRLVRVFIAAAFAALYFTGVVTNTTVATVLWVIGIVFVVTAAIGFCPLYTIKKWNTNKRK
jgi:hypothetical protein